MNAAAALIRLKEAGVRVAVADGQLKLKGPKAVVQDEKLLDELRAIKSALIIEATLAEWRTAAASVRTDNMDVAKLKTATLRFLDSEDARTAVTNGWDAMALFGLHEGNAPKERVGCWGLVVFVAWGTYARTDRHHRTRNHACSALGRAQRKPCHAFGRLSMMLSSGGSTLGITNAGGVNDDCA